MNGLINIIADVLSLSTGNVVADEYHRLLDELDL
jgi:hypothetical protein